MIASNSTLCVCGHTLLAHKQHDDGVHCFSCRANCREYRKAEGSNSPSAILSAGVTPEGLAGETVAESVNDSDEARARLHERIENWPINADQKRQEHRLLNEALGIDGNVLRAEPRPSASAIRSRRWREQNPERVRLANEKRHAGERRTRRLVRIEEYDRLLAIEREAAAAPALDVERLVQILAALEGFPGQPSVKNRTHAEFIAAEYARLSENGTEAP